MPEVKCGVETKLVQRYLLFTLTFIFYSFLYIWSGHLDLTVNGDFRTSAIYWNNGDGTFTDGTKSSGVGTDENGMGSTVADFDFDGLQDWFLTSIYITKEQMKPFYEVYKSGGFIFGYTGSRLYKNKGGR
jgi:hypothetical protein